MEENVYKNGLAELVDYYCTVPAIEEKIIKFSSVRSVVVWLYEVLVTSNDLSPIESLAKEQKQRLWNKTKAKGLTMKERKDAVKATYLMNKLIPDCVYSGFDNCSSRQDTGRF
jgi:hypothetical protein